MENVESPVMYNSRNNSAEQRMGSLERRPR